MKFNSGVFYQKLLSNCSVYLYHRILTTTLHETLHMFLCLSWAHIAKYNKKKVVGTFFTGTDKTDIISPVSWSLDQPLNKLNNSTLLCALVFECTPNTNDSDTSQFVPHKSKFCLNMNTSGHALMHLLFVL